MDDIHTYADLVRTTEEDYADDERVRVLLLVTAKAAYEMGKKGL